MKNPKNILITGASSGIGQEIALLYAKAGINLVITGRDKKRLLATATTLEKKGAGVIARVLDVTDQKAMAAFIVEVDKKTPLDLVIANAGIGVQHGDFKTLDEAAKATFEVNVFGVFNTIHPALAVMKERGRGQIALVSSLAGYIGLPGAPIYSASKNAVRAYGESLRA
ncbi:MAG: SDR family NAD(P)-dependent oxidoreductase, partial [Sphingomonadales bacterium]